jgi:hypothetical protein
MYVPWLCNDADITDVGGVEATARATYQTAFDGFFDQLAAAAPTGPDCPMYLLHSTSPEQATSPGSPNLVTNLIVDPVVATQRRRLVR